MSRKEEKYLNEHPEPVLINQTEAILRQMKNNVCQICKDNGIKGTGFFCKIPLSKDNFFPAFITNNHLIDEKYLEEKENISIKMDNGINFNFMSISLKNKFKLTNKDYDVTIVEINPNIDKIKDFLEFDDNIFNDPKHYVGNSIYVLHYPIEFAKDKVAVSYGIIKEINKEEEYDFNHYCSTTKGSSGSPILNLSNNKVVGIHKLSSNEEFNMGAFLYYPLKEFIDKYKINEKEKEKKKEKKEKEKERRIFKNVEDDYFYYGELKQYLNKIDNKKKNIILLSTGS